VAQWQSLQRLAVQRQRQEQTARGFWCHTGTHKEAGTTTWYTARQQCWVIGPGLIEQIWFGLSNFQKCYPNNSFRRPNTARQQHKETGGTAVCEAARIAAYVCIPHMHSCISALSSHPHVAQLRNHPVCALIHAAPGP